MLMPRFVARNIQSNMGEIIGVDAVKTLSGIMTLSWLAIAGENAQQRKPTLLNNS